MGVVKKRSVKALLAGIDDHERTSKRIKGGNFKTLKTLCDEFFKTDSKPHRDRLINEFKKRNEEFLKFLNSNPDLRACSVSFYVRIFRHNFVGDKEKSRRNTDVLQGFLTLSTAKFAEKTCEKRY